MPHPVLHPEFLSGWTVSQPTAVANDLILVELDGRQHCFLISRKLEKTLNNRKICFYKFVNVTKFLQFYL